MIITSAKVFFADRLGPIIKGLKNPQFSVFYKIITFIFPPFFKNYTHTYTYILYIFKNI